MRIQIILIAFILVQSLNVTAQQTSEEPGHHHDHKNEIGMANSPVYFVNEKVFTYGLHLHYIRSVSETPFGLGLGYERIFDEHKHNTISIVGSYRPLEQLTLIASPGLTFESNESSGKFALHIESSYEFELGNFHLGPVAEIAYDPEDYHMSLGLHLGYGF